MDQNRLIEFTQDLVRLPSLSGAEEAVARRVEAELRALQFDQIWTDTNGSVVGIIDGARPGKTLLFDAHTDTVGISPGVPWQHDPFGAQIDGDAIFGRGAADLKGALAAMVYAAASTDRSRLRGRIVVSASTLEEVLEGVALKAVMDATPPDFVVICLATYDRRLLPGETPASVLGTITERLATTDITLRAEIGQGEYRAYTGAVLRCEKFFPAWLYPEADPFVAQVRHGLNMAGLQPQTSAYRFCTNAAYSAGLAGVPTVGFGPATEADAHVVDERLRVADLLAAANGYAGIIAAVLG